MELKAGDVFMVIKSVLERTFIMIIEHEDKFYAIDLMKGGYWEETHPKSGFPLESTIHNLSVEGCVFKKASKVDLNLEI